jgi:oxygen-independent coproporphyrinogen-3 oxidase
MQGYIDRLCSDISAAPQISEAAGGRFERHVDSIYFGGGTPSLLAPEQLAQVFAALRSSFDVQPDSEITVECAPGTLSDAVPETVVGCGANRVSLGVQSFVDEEACAVGRLHTREIAVRDIERVRNAGISNVNVDLIAGLPHQTGESWETSLDIAIEIGVPHVSVYMLEVDDDSRLGRELLAGGTRYHAHFVPEEESMIAFYNSARERLENAGVMQYEISNFARAGMESRHNLKYWTRQPYFGFGVDAHSMLFSDAGRSAAVRLAWPDELDTFAASGATPKPRIIKVDKKAALEEAFFLGLRLNRGVDLRAVAAEFGLAAARDARAIIHEQLPSGFIECENDVVRLTSAGRLASNEVFERFLHSQPEQPVSSTLA